MTAQCFEILTYQGRQMDLAETPLEHYLERLAKVRRPNPPMRSTALYRGYIGHWAIRDDYLWLDALELATVEPPHTEILTVPQVFPWRKGPIRADWINWELRCVAGRELRYVHAMFQSTFSHEHFFHFSKGRFVGESVRLNTLPLIYDIASDGSRTARDADGSATADPLPGVPLDRIEGAWVAAPDPIDSPRGPGGATLIPG